MTYYVENEGCFLVNLKRALNGEGLKGGAWTASIRKGKKFSTFREARKVAEQLSGAHVYRWGTRDGICWASGETRRYERSDPLGVYGGEPYFRKVKKRG